MTDPAVFDELPSSSARRTTWELIALIFALTVALVILTATVGVAILLQDTADPPLGAILNAIGAAASTMLGALVVIMAGRRSHG
jgi:hypothetical protein